MSRRTFESFLSRIWLFLALVGTFLLVLQGLHVVSQVRGRGRVEEEVARRAVASARLVLAQLDRDELLEQLRAYTRRGATLEAPDLPRPTLQELGIRSIEMLSAEGWDASSRSAPGTEAVPSAGPDAAQRRRLASGEAVVDTSPALSGPSEYAAVIAYEPILDGDGRLLGTLRLEVDAEALARAHRETTWNVAITTGALVTFVALLVFFTRWMLRPLRLLARTAASPQDPVTDEFVRQDETGFVLETYRRMIAQLQEKEQELRRLREVERNRADELQELNASIVDSMVSGALILDLSGRVRSVNDACRQVLGVAPGRVAGRPFRDVLAHVPELHSKLQACLEHGTVIRREELRLSIAGIGRRDVGLTLSPLRDRDGARTGALCLLVDLTEVKALQEQVRLKASLAELGELSAGIAHEFRNSLATILGYAKLAEKGTSGDVADHARAIGQEAQALGRVVDDFLRFANPTRLVVETVDLARLFAELAEDVAQRAAGKRVAFSADERMPVVSGDETLLKRTFTNVLRNAVDAVRDDGRIEVHAEPGQGCVTIHVDDDGPGIPPADREKIFTPFFTRKERGTGLGLALARKIVVHHGGRLAVDSSPLGGARFSVTLPLRSEREG